MTCSFTACLGLVLALLVGGALDARAQSAIPATHASDAHLEHAARDLASRMLEGATIVELQSGEHWAVGVGTATANSSDTTVDARRSAVVASHRARRELVRLLVGSHLVGRSRLARGESDRGAAHEEFDEQLLEELSGTLIGVESVAAGPGLSGTRWVALACRVDTCIAR